MIPSKADVHLPRYLESRSTTSQNLHHLLQADTNRTRHSFQGAADLCCTSSVLHIQASLRSHRSCILRLLPPSLLPHWPLTTAASSSPHLDSRYHGLHNPWLVRPQPHVQSISILGGEPHPLVSRYGRAATHGWPWQEKEIGRRHHRRAKPETHIAMLYRPRPIRPW